MVGCRDGGPHERLLTQAVPGRAEPEQQTQRTKWEADRATGGRCLGESTRVSEFRHPKDPSPPPRGGEGGVQAQGSATWPRPSGHLFPRRGGSQDSGGYVATLLPLRFGDPETAGVMQPFQFPPMHILPPGGNTPDASGYKAEASSGTALVDQPLVPPPPGRPSGPGILQARGA